MNSVQMLNQEMKQMNEMQNIKLGIKYGFIGLGMGGGSIAAACADISTSIQNNKYPYTALLINTNINDYSKLQTRNQNIHLVGLDGYEMGAGRDIEMGQDAFVKNKDKVKKALEQYMEDRDFIWIVAGLGGGTGTGSILACLNLLFESGYGDRVGLILTLPSDSEGYNVISNALKRLQKIYQTKDHLGAIIFVDNQKLYQEFIKEEPNKSDDDYLKFSNMFVAHTLHSMNIVTSSFKHRGSEYFDQSELLKMLKTSGVLSISKVSYDENAFDVSNKASYIPRFKEGVENGILSSDYNLKTAKLASVNFIVNQKSANRIYTMEFVSSIKDILEEYVPTADEKPLSEFIKDEPTNKIDTFILFAGLDMPKRALDLIDQKDKIEKERESIKNTHNPFEEKFASLTFEDDKPKKEQKTALFDLEGTEEDNESQKSKSFNPFNQ
ncbi:plasmid replication protein [Gracilibacillus sp. YIM 98692]|uniref:plasmid replication protein n=1 Tax=Gracilibacillus sp. YIM 98692 TaxID=2663532 RepID=UPI0013D3438C|nr:plasmid replication protein [Gracilibacillus sp. YIM 98692]